MKAQGRMNEGTDTDADLLSSMFGNIYPLLIYVALLIIEICSCTIIRM
jgi:hypothetical protein